MCLVSCQQHLDSTHWPKTNRREFLTIKQIAFYVKNTTTILVYWYLIVATCSGPSLNVKTLLVRMYSI